MKRTDVVAFLSGVLFAVGLCISGMTMPTKVLGFLDVFGDWDPALLFVMVGAIGVHCLFARRAASGAKPFFASETLLPKITSIDGRLIAGAALFGVGWGIAGFCPGPALVSLVTGKSGALAFVAAMLVGMGAHAALFERRAATAATDRVCA